MKSKHLAITVLLLTFSFFIPFITNTAAAESQPPSLFRIVDERPGFDKQTASIAGMTQELAIAIETAAIDSAPEALQLFLPGGQEVTARKQRFTASKKFLTWSGKIEGGDGPSGFVLLIDRGERISGVVNIGNDRYRIVATETGHRLVRIELETATCGLRAEGLHSSFAMSESAGAEHYGLEGPERAFDWGASALPTSNPSTSNPATSDPTTGAAAAGEKSLATLDLLAIYPSAISGAAEVAAIEFIEDSVVLANEIFANSQIDARYELVATVKLTAADQPPATGLVDAIEWMTPQQMGGEDVDQLGPPEMLALREDYAADMVALFVPLSYDDNNFCGIANLPEADGTLHPYVFGGPSHGDFGKRAFTANRIGCGLADFTLAHELGHNFGMRHDDDGTTAEHLFTFGRGHQLEFTPWQNNANGTLETDVPGHFAVGYHFTPLVDGVIVGLGGLWNGEKHIRLYEKEPLTRRREADVVSNNQWAYEAVFPFEVLAGKTYTVAVFTDGDGGSIYHNPIEFPQTYNGLITIEGTTVVSTLNNPNVAPTNTITDVMYGQVDIQFVAEASVMGCVPNGGDITGAVCNRVPHFSDPDITFEGITTGTADRDNGRVAELQVDSYSQFFDNSAPNCQDDSLSTTVDTPLTIPLGAILGNDSDPDGDGIRLVDWDTTTAQGGSNDTEHAGGFIYTPPSGYSGMDWFEYTIADRPPNHPAIQFDTCTVQVDITGASQAPIGEVGEVSLLTHVQQTVFLALDYSDPVVIAQTVSENESDTAVVRITDVQSDRFTFYVQEAPNQNGTHGAEKVAYLVLESGDWRLPSGEWLRVGTFQTSKTVGRSVANQWATVGFGSNAFNPIFLSQVQSNNDSSWVKTRHRYVGTASTQLALERSEADANAHGLETIGWIAIQPSSGLWDGLQFVAATTPNAVTHLPYTLPGGISVAPPRLFAAMASYDGQDNAALRYGNVGIGSLYVRVEEDTSLDGETTHTSEAVGYLTISGNGVLTGTPD